jgi:methyl-accepting chemotaxis protein
MKIKSYRDWAIFWKIMLIPTICLILILLGTELLILPKIESWLMEQEKLKVRNVVEVVYQQIAQGAKAVEERHIPLEEAQKEVIRHVKELRYSGSEYFWINDLTPRMVMHPTQPQLDGQDLSENKDPNGKYIFREFVKVCTDKGDGFVSYMWAKPGETQPTPKISYVKLYQPWGWIVGSGLYIDNFRAKISSLHNFILAASLFFSLATITLAWSIGRGVKRSIKRGCAFAEAVASGDMTGTLEVSGADEVGVLGNSLNTMVVDLKSMIGRITLTTGELATTSKEIALASRSMITSAEQQTADVAETSAAAQQIQQQIDSVTRDVTGLNESAAHTSTSVWDLVSCIEEVSGHMDKLSLSVGGISDSITRMAGSIRQIDGGVQTLTDTSAETASSVLEFDTSIRQIEAYAKESAAISDKLRGDAETGKRAVEETIAGIDVIIQASRTTADAISDLSHKAQSIGSIVTVIDEIAGQTNLLALNASIISAQAGEHGKGFGVVAAEIKQLAERTGRSTKEIADTVKGIQEQMKRAVAAIQASEESIKAGGKLSLKAGDALGKVVGGVTQTAQQMSEIARATREQARGSELIRTAMEQVATMTNTIAETTSALRAGSEQINGEVGKLREVSSQVMRSMREQAVAGEQIGRLTLHVSESSARIQEACEDQTKGGKRIQQAVESIKVSADSVRQETRVVDGAVSKLGSNTKSLQQEMSSFKL